MAQHSLFEFLTRTEIPRIPLRAGVERTRNTRSDTYPPKSVNPVPWNNFFTYHTIMQSQYATALGVNVTKDPVNSPPLPVSGEQSVRAQLGEYVYRRMRRALANTPYPPSHTQMRMETGDMAYFESSNALPDFVGHMVSGNIPRLPGDIKCSWNWKSSWRNSQVQYEWQEFVAVVAQLNFQMNNACSWYGYILTDTELVLFCKKDNQYANHIEMALGIPLAQHDSRGAFTHASGHLTALLALWYIHMLVSNDHTWSVDGTKSDPEADMDSSSDFE